MIEAVISKSYGAARVLREAKLSVAKGTVHALVGENGAGKSTLVKVLAGVVSGEGSVSLDGVAIALGTWDRVAARAAGVGIVMQHGSFAGTLSVVENAVLGVEGGEVLALEAPAHELARRGVELGLAVNPWATVDALTVGAVQRAEIVTAIVDGARVLILDEPTAVLAPPEVEGLLARLRELAAAGTTVIIVTHKLDEVRAVADAVTVLRAGETVATFGRPFSVGEIAVAMVGAELPALERTAPPGPDARLQLEVTRPGVTLDVRAGEIVGVAGVDGNGQKELALAIAGLAPAHGVVRIGGVDVSFASARQRLDAGLAHVPEDRHHGGLWMQASIADNLVLGRRDVTGGFQVDREAIARFADARIAELDIRPPQREAIVQALSGGNQQKVVIGRELSRPGLKAVVASQPTRGVDLGAARKIHDRLRDAAASGAGVLVISADLDELLALCHRVVVMLRGRIVGERVPGDGARAELGAWMTGAA